MGKYVIWIFLFAIVLFSCNQKGTEPKAEIRIDSTISKTPKVEDNYKIIVFKNSSKSKFFDEKYRKTADSALIIAAAVLNSNAFRDSISKYVFSCKNYLNKCYKKCNDCEDTIYSKTIFDSLYRTSFYTLELNLENKRGRDGSFGNSSENNSTIESYFITINEDISTVSFAYKYAYHICHEYMHIVGFYHYLGYKERIRNEDIAEKTGWVTAEILEDWQNRNVKIEGL